MRLLSFKGSIRVKLTLAISLTILMITSVVSAVFIWRNFQETITSLISRGFLLAKSISVLSASYIAGFQFFEIQRAIEDIVAKDKEIVFGYLEDINGFVVISKDEVYDTLDKSRMKEISKIYPSTYGIMEDIKISTVRYGEEECIEIEIPIVVGEKISYYLGFGLTTKYLNENLFRNLIISILVVVFFILLGVLFSFSLARNFSVPILKLKEAAVRFGNKDFNYSIQIKSEDEIGILAETFESMRRSIKEYSENLEELVRQRTQELQEAYEKLKEKDRIMQMELDLASRIQKGIMPNRGIMWKDYVFVGFSQPMEKIGGDFFDIIPLPNNRMLFYIADVSGHGIPAALITTMLKISVLNIAFEKKYPSEILEELNRRIRIVNTDMVSTVSYLTAFVGIIENDSSNVSYSIGGHHMPLIYSHSKKDFVEIKDTQGTIIGIIDPELYIATHESIGIQKGDKIFLYTDGITERRNLHGEELGLERLKEIIIRGIEMELSEKRLLGYILRNIEDFADGVPPRDDYTMLILEKIK